MSYRPLLSYASHIRADFNYAKDYEFMAKLKLTLHTSVQIATAEIYKYVRCLYGFCVQDFSSPEGELPYLSVSTASKRGLTHTFSV